MRIESASRSDLEWLLEQWRALAAEQRAHGSHVAPADNRELIRERFAHDVVADRVLLARDGEARIGFGAFALERPALERDVTRGVVRYVRVLPERRDEGVGTALFEAVEDELADRGADVVTLEVLADHAAARRLYERRGYEPHRIAYEKPLGTGND